MHIAPNCVNDQLRIDLGLKLSQVGDADSLAYSFYSGGEMTMISRSAIIDPMNVVVPQYAEGVRIVMNRLRKYPHEPSNVPCVRSERVRNTPSRYRKIRCVLLFSFFLGIFCYHVYRSNMATLGGDKSLTRF